jgi:hypothetical protein
MCIKITEIQNRQTIKVLEDLLRKARKRELNGIAFSVSFNHDHHGIGLTGDYLEDPLTASAAIGALSHSIDNHARESHVISAIMH